MEFKHLGVSAITMTGVTVTFDALTEAQEDVVFDVVDNNGNVVEVEPVSVLDVGETTATIKFKTALTSEPAGVWTVNGVEFDADAQAAVAAVKNADNQVEKWNALQSSYFTGVNPDLLDKYLAADFNNVDTVADVQEIIDEVNKDNITTEQVKAVKEAKNQVELLKALQDGGFARVNADLIDKYAIYDSASDGPDYKEVDDGDADAVQEIIDAVNKKAAEDAVDEATTGNTALTTKAIADAQALVSALPEKEDQEKADKKDLQDSLDKANAFVKVKAATTQASLLSALKAPVLDLKNIDDSLAKYYKQKFDADKDSIDDVSYDLQTKIVNAGKTAAITDYGKKISEVTEKTSLSDLKGLLTELKRLDDTTFTSDIVDGLLENYRTDLVAKDAADRDTTSEINTIINDANDPTSAVSDVKSASDANDLLAALKDPTLNLSNVKEANKDAYFKAAVNKKDPSNPVKYFENVSSKEDTQKVVNAVNAFVDANNATTATEMRTALTTFAVALDSIGGVNEASEFINLTNAAKLEVAEIVLNGKDADYPDAYELGEAVDAAMDAHGQFLTNVNGAANINAMKAALNDEDAFPTFVALDANDKVVKAEAVYNKLQELKSEKTPTDFKTISEIKAAAGL